MRWAWVLGLGQEFPELKGKQTVELQTRKAETPKNTWVVCSLVEDGDVEENPGPTTTVSCLNTQVHSIVEGKLPFMLRSWQRCLTEEGVEPNPGPSSLITIHRLNVDGKHKTWKFMNQFAAERKEVAILQEVNLNKEE